MSKKYQKLGMGEIINIGDLDFRNYCTNFCNCNIDIDNYHISFLKISPFEFRKVEIDELIQFDTNSQW
jgi:hypothetical protein